MGRWRILFTAAHVWMIPLQYVNAGELVEPFRVADPFGFKGTGFCGSLCYKANKLIHGGEHGGKIHPFEKGERGDLVASLARDLNRSIGPFPHQSRPIRFISMENYRIPAAPDLGLQCRTHAPPVSDWKHAGTAGFALRPLDGL